jgi:hypothetical protein
LPAVPGVPGVPSAEVLSALPAVELAARLAEAYRVIGELTAQVGRLSARVDELERQGTPGFAGIVAAPVVGQPL